VVTHTYSTIGTYVATLTAVQTSTKAESSDQVTITVTRRK
jgi:PKD repeat protein